MQFTSTNPIWYIQKTFFKTINNSETLASNAIKVFTTVPPETKMPYILINSVKILKQQSLYSPRFNATIEVSAFDTNKSIKNLANILAAINTAVTLSNLNINAETGMNFLSLEDTGNQISTDVLSEVIYASIKYNCELKIIDN